ncbi:hypothetical protein EWM64_g10221 [Hericium alpestre]|uniref:Uncharacterized protein n=1 Tax=Hericium alpestre TaxID=135208 RepID=A0A4Y9ZIV9_9AGAM|nr:hypothetical protein EWM64_g10221 [Hericium alpestre]
MVSKLDREERGVGMQNFRYSPSYDEFIHIVSIQSPEVHRFLSEHLAARTQRSFREKEARQPKFPMKICERTYSLVAEQLKALDYDGPVALSCDDTKLFASWRIYWDSVEKGIFLVGAAGEPLRVADPDNLKRTISDASAVKATKVRLWCIQIPLPKVAPIIVAAIPIEGTMSASDLLEYLEPLVNGLLAHNIRVVSYACDGTESERSLQRLLTSCGTGQIQQSIPNFFDPSSAFDIIIPTFNDYPIIMIQDSKHALKTFCNNLFSGARLLVLGNYVAIYEHIRQMAMEDGSPLYHRDVNKLDRQDDNAATCLFSADTLDYLAKHHPEYLGEIIYLFVFGELVDAYQNRQISHAERIKMALRAKYFLVMWKLYLQHAGYKESQHFLSREAADIANILIHGILGLILIHCDHLPDTFPLLPWLHSSEPCEHVFGEARRVVKDFTMLDFLHMIPKLQVKLKEAAFRATTGDAKARASGYTHTYFDAKDTDLHALAMYPDDREISWISQEACEDAEALISLLGIQAAYLMRPTSNVPVGLPGIASWYGADGAGTSVDDDNTELDIASDADEESICEAQELQDLIDAEESGALGTGFSNQDDEAFLNIKFAALAVAADEFMQIQSLPEEEDLPDLHAQQSNEIRDTMANMMAGTGTAPRIAPLDLPDDPTRPLGLGCLTVDDIDFSALMSIRRRNQTRQAAKGTRQANSKQAFDTESSLDVTLTIRQELLKQCYEIIRSQQERAIGTGYERAARWIEPESGNVANARLASDANATKVLAKRKKVFTQANVPMLDHVVNACVSSLRPLRIGDYGIIFTEHGLMVGHVIALYSKSNGRYGKHCSVQQASNIAGLSYVAIQAFQYIRARQFASVTKATAAWQTKQFILAPSMSFLCLFPRMIAPVAINRNGFELPTEAAHIFDILSKKLSKFAGAMKQFRSRKKALSDNEEAD